MECDLKKEIVEDNQEATNGIDDVKHYKITSKIKIRFTYRI